MFQTVATCLFSGALLSPPGRQRAWQGPCPRLGCCDSSAQGSAAAWARGASGLGKNLDTTNKTRRRRGNTYTPTTKREKGAHQEEKKEGKTAPTKKTKRGEKTRHPTKTIIIMTKRPPKTAFPVGKAWFDQTTAEKPWLKVERLKIRNTVPESCGQLQGMTNLASGCP